MNYKLWLMFLLIGITRSILPITFHFSSSFKEELLCFLFLKKKQKNSMAFFMIRDNEQDLLQADFRIDYWEKELEKEKKNSEQLGFKTYREQELEEKIKKERTNKYTLLSDKSELESKKQQQEKQIAQKKALEQQKQTVPSKENTYISWLYKFYPETQEARGLTACIALLAAWGIYYQFFSK